MWDGVAKGKVPRFQISRDRGWHPCVCFSTDGLYARSDAEISEYDYHIYFFKEQNKTLKINHIYTH